MALILKGVETMVKDAIAENTYSPDISKLDEMFTHVPVFITGTEKNRCFEHNDVLKGHEPTGWGYTQKPSFLLYIHKKSKLPVVMYNPASPAAARIYGEIYLLRPSELMRLDTFHQNTVFTKRGWRPILAYHKSEGGNMLKTYHEVDAIMYTGNPRTIEPKDYYEGTVVESKGVQPYYMWGMKEDSIAQHTPINKLPF